MELSAVSRFHRFFYTDTSLLLVASKQDGVQAKGRCEVFETVRASLPLNPHDIAAVASLGTPISPAAVLGAVVAIVVDAINAVARWAWPHIYKKGLEVVSPPVTHNDATTPICGESLAVAIVATGFRTTPRAIFSRMGPRMPVADSSCAQHFSAQTTTATAPTTPKGRTVNGPSGAAIAQTVPPLRMSPVDCQPPTKPNASQPKPLIHASKIGNPVGMIHPDTAHWAGATLQSCP